MIAHALILILLILTGTCWTQCTCMESQGFFQAEEDSEGLSSTAQMDLAVIDLAETSVEDGRAFQFFSAIFVPQNSFLLPISRGPPTA